MAEQLPKPKNGLVAAVFAVIDILVLGLGENAAIAAGVAAAPWLKLPIISSLFGWVVKALAEALDSVLKLRIGKLIIRLQGGAKQVEYDTVIDEFKQAPPASVDAEAHAKALQKAKDAIDRMVDRSGR